MALPAHAASRMIDAGRGHSPRACGAAHPGSEAVPPPSLHCRGMNVLRAAAGPSAAPGTAGQYAGLSPSKQAALASR